MTAGVTHTRGSALGDFLAAKRAARRPEEIGLPVASRRRVPGLRRDEVAARANISVDYLARLEQGRETSPSPPVLAALSDALLLTPDEVAHLHRLAGVVAETPTSRLDAAEVRRLLAPVIGSWDHTVAFVIDPVLNIVLRNELADTLFAPVRHRDNLLHMVMLDAAGRRLYADWARAAESCVAALRATEHHAEPGALARVLAPMADDQHFADLWERHVVNGKSTHSKTLTTPAGDIEVIALTLEISGAPGWLLVVYQAAPGTADERRLLSLADGTLSVPAEPGSEESSEDALVY